MVATVAFGMGIDKSNVRHVIHYGAPKTLETYYQQAGRAGRDGLPSSCVLFWAPGDFAVAGSFAAEMQSAKAREQVQTGIDCMRRYCATASCRRKALLAYFGALAASPPPVTSVVRSYRERRAEWVEGPSLPAQGSGTVAHHPPADSHRRGRRSVKPAMCLSQRAHASLMGAKEVSETECGSPSIGTSPGKVFHLVRQGNPNRPSCGVRDASGPSDTVYLGASRGGGQEQCVAVRSMRRLSPRHRATQRLRQ